VIGNRLAVSNIAWEIDEESRIAAVLAELGVEFVEVAPSKVFANPMDAPASEVSGYRDFWQRRGIEIVAFQSLLFGHPELTLFDSPAARSDTLDYLSRMIELAARLGAGVLVFGSPRSRFVPDGMNAAAAHEFAVDFFRTLGERAERNGVTFCIEPNPTEYGCNFVTDSIEGRQLVEAVDRPGFGLHLDAAGMTMAGEDVASAIVASASVLKHFHASAPQLAPLNEESVQHRSAGEALAEIEYRGFVSIEMRAIPDAAVENRVRAAVTLARDAYGISSAA
jgi:D-psicose/D-tagatose/L-ribulose 3-epimerase